MDKILFYILKGGQGSAPPLGNKNAAGSHKKRVFPPVAATPEHQKRFTNGGEFGKRPPPVADRVHYTSRLQSFLKDGNIVVRRHLSSIDNLAQNGRLGTQHEIDEEKYEGGGWYDPHGRRNVEHQGFGVSQDAPPEERPVYGYVVANADNKRADPYGEMKIYLKPDVKERTYVTFGDSLEALEEGDVLPMRYDTADWRAVVRNTSASSDLMRYGTLDMYNAHADYDTEYLEAQILGGVRLSNVKKIMYPRYFKPSQGELNRPPTGENKAPEKSSLAVYKKHGIEVVDENGKSWY